MSKNQSKNGISMKNVFAIGGAYIAFCIGSGFATGQDLLQYFGGFGAYGFIGMLVAICLHGYTMVSFLRTGLRHEFTSTLDIFAYYSGPTIGKILLVLFLFFAFLNPTVMISGFGATLNQHMGTPIIVGNVLMGLISIATVLGGLKRLVDIIGMIGPFLTTMTILTGLYFLITHYQGFAEGIAVAPSVDQPRMGVTWLDSGINYASWAPILAAPFLIRAARGSIKNVGEAIGGGVYAVIFFGLATATMLAAFFCDYANISSKMSPTLYMAGQISGILASVFILVIFLGMYSSTVPHFYTISTTFAAEGTKKFRILVVCLITVSTLTTMVLPFNKLLNLVFSTYGYIGMVFIVLVIVKDIKVLRERKKAVIAD